MGAWSLTSVASKREVSAIDELSQSSEKENILCCVCVCVSSPSHARPVFVAICSEDNIREVCGFTCKDSLTWIVDTYRHLLEEDGGRGLQSIAQ